MAQNPVLVPYIRTAHYYETDKMGVVHHSNYIRWLEETRIDLMNQAGLPYTEMEAMGVMIPVVSASCNYKYPVKFGDTVEIHPFITEFNGCRFRLEYEIRNLTSGKLSATCNTSHCFVNMQFKPIRTQKEFPQIYEIFNNCIKVKI